MEFEAAVPNLFDIRDTQEHFDDYGGGAGYRQLRGEQPSGWGYGLGPFGPILTYGNVRVNMYEAVEAARALHKAIRLCVDALAAKDVHGGPETVIIPDP